MVSMFTRPNLDLNLGDFPDITSWIFLRMINDDFTCCQRKHGENRAVYQKISHCAKAECGITRLHLAILARKWAALGSALEQGWVQLSVICTPSTVWNTELSSGSIADRWYVRSDTDMKPLIQVWSRCKCTSLPPAWAEPRLGPAWTVAQMALKTFQIVIFHQGFLWQH